MLSTKEQQLLVETLTSYPAGIPDDSWGHGPMRSPMLHWENISIGEAEEYG